MLAHPAARLLVAAQGALAPNRRERAVGSGFHLQGGATHELPIVRLTRGASARHTIARIQLGRGVITTPA
jgi:hypothetical protein